MPNKRSKRKKTPIFHCPYCERRLWRLGSQKYYLFYQDAIEVKKHLGFSSKTAKLVMANRSTYIDRNSWIEEFFCENDGQVWLHLNSKPDGMLTTAIARENDWKRTTKTIDPRIPNPSVSEYSYCMSRNTYKARI